MEETRCRHPSCDCPATETSDYCSAACARAATGGISEAGCECGHEGCGAGDEPSPEA